MMITMIWMMLMAEMMLLLMMMMHFSSLKVIPTKSCWNIYMNAVTNI